MKINHNIPAMKTLNQLNSVSGKVAKSMERLSSGLRINSAADDAAGLAIANKMDSQVRGLRQANRNAMDGISMIQTAEGATNEMHAMLQRVRELTVQASNDTYADEDRAKVKQEIDALVEEIDRISETTEFNQKKLIEADTTANLQIGANQGQIIEVEFKAINSGTLGIGGIDVSTHATATVAIADIDAAISTVSEERAKLGAIQNRLEHTTANLGISEENITASMSRIQDADMAHEMAQFTQYNVISQAATSMLAQANQIPQQVLQLLQG